MAFLFQPALKIFYRVHRRVHWPAQLCFDAMKQSRDSLKTNITNNHYIYVTFGSGLSRSNRPVNESDLDVIPNGFENSSKYLDQSNSLDQHLLEFWEYWAGPAPLVVDAISILMSFQKPGFGKSSQITLDTGWLQMNLTRELAEVPLLIRLQNCRRKERLFRRRKQWI